MAVEAQALRIAQSRAALEEQADLDQEQLAEVDSIMEQMNADLAMLGQDLLDLATSETEPLAVDMLGVSHDVTGILYEAQLALQDTVGSEALSDVEPQAREVWNYVDMEVFRDTVQGYEL